eukprot:COSAG05_NODE_7_length_42457_cov_58.929152_23_plen_52_part_00
MCKSGSTTGAMDGLTLTEALKSVPFHARQLPASVMSFVRNRHCPPSWAPAA